jgi:DNA-binding response OmpR family regulator
MSRYDPHARILIVDDEPHVRLVFRTALESLHDEIVAAEDAAGAFEALGRESFDLVLLDLNMPVMGGMDVLRRLRDEGNNVPVVIITAHGSVPNAVEAMKLGAIDFLMKPIAPDALRRIVAEVLDRHAVRVPTATEPARPVTAAGQFATHMTETKRHLNHRDFEQAEVHLKQAIALEPDSAEAHNLMGVLHELRNEHDASYREYRLALKADRHHEPANHNMTRYYERFTFGRSNEPIDLGDGAIDQPGHGPGPR